MVFTGFTVVEPLLVHAATRSSAHFSCPDVTAPVYFYVLSKKRCIRQLVLRLLLEDSNCLGAEHNMPPA